MHDVLARVLAQAGDVAVHDRDVALEPLAREDGEDAAAVDDDVGELVAARATASLRARSATGRR